MGEAEAKERRDLQAQVVHRQAVAQRAVAVAERPVPLTQRVRGGGQMRQGSPGPPAVPQRLERAQRPLAGLHGQAQLAREDVDLRQAGLREGAQLDQPAALRDRDRPLAVVDDELGPPAGQGVQEPGPVVPRRAARGIGGALDQRSDLLEQRTLLHVLADREAHLALS